MAISLADMFRSAPGQVQPGGLYSAAPIPRTPMPSAPGTAYTDPRQQQLQQALAPFQQSMTPEQFQRLSALPPEFWNTSFGGDVWRTLPLAGTQGYLNQDEYGNEAATARAAAERPQMDFIEKQLGYWDEGQQRMKDSGASPGDMPAFYADRYKDFHAPVDASGPAYLGMAALGMGALPLMGAAGGAGGSAGGLSELGAGQALGAEAGTEALTSSAMTDAAFGGGGATVAGGGGTGLIDAGTGLSAAEAGGAAAGLGAGEAAATGVAGGSALSRLTGMDPDLASVLGTVGGAGLGVAGSMQQTAALERLAREQMAFGAPSRGRFEASMTPGFDVTSIPGYKGALDSTMESMLSKLAAQGGNPWGNPSGLIEANKRIISGTALPAVQEYQRTNLAGGGLANLNAAAPGTAASAIGSQGNVWNAIGSGLSSLTNPQPTLADLLKGMRGLA